MKYKRILVLVWILYVVAGSLLLIRYVQLRKPAFWYSITSLSTADQDTVFSNAVAGKNQIKFTKYLLVTYIRSGSTFLADLVQADRGTYYAFEPLNYLRIQVNRMNDSHIDDAVEILQGMFNCSESWIANMVTRYPNMSRFNIARFYRELKAKNSTSCQNSRVIASACSESNIKVLKVVRLRVRQLKVMFEKYPNFFKSVKVLVNRRDPRGMYNSRSTRPWCQPPTQCADYKIMCEEMREDIEVYKVLKKQYPSNFVAVRFEDLAIEAYQRSKLLYRELGLAWSYDVQQFIKQHTGDTSDSKLTRHPYSTYRDSRSVPFAWLAQLSWTEVDMIQKECSDVMKTFGYNLINETFFNSNEDFDLNEVLDLNYVDG